MLHELEQTVKEKIAANEDSSYTNYLVQAGREKIAKKFGEEAFEVVLAGDDTLAEETADLLYHLTVLLADRGVSYKEVEAVLNERHGTKSTFKDRPDIERW
ncbi:MAG: phosphoribosyl-ATP diphosphatase [Exiguobacterium oxidotolerans]|uniref:phosphoribosyl-ATP diphosphatase n=1 Tax=Exiguobacterium sp. H66 TaxID=2751208 RepID=UPI0013301428|nr:phosphoribosyl-ATP diphosphatase [Exiguobacterium oxidotolerans]